MSQPGIRRLCLRHRLALLCRSLQRTTCANHQANVPHRNGLATLAACHCVCKVQKSQLGVWQDTGELRDDSRVEWLAMTGGSEKFLGVWRRAMGILASFSGN